MKKHIPDNENDSTNALTLPLLCTDVLNKIVGYLQVSDLPAWFGVCRRLSTVDFYHYIGEVHFGKALFRHLVSVVQTGDVREVFRQHYESRRRVELPFDCKEAETDFLSNFVFIMDVKITPNKRRSFLVHPKLQEGKDHKIRS